MAGYFQEEDPSCMHTASFTAKNRVNFVVYLSSSLKNVTRRKFREVKYALFDFMETMDEGVVWVINEEDRVCSEFCKQEFVSIYKTNVFPVTSEFHPYFIGKCTMHVLIGDNEMMNEAKRLREKYKNDIFHFIFL